MYNEKCWLDLTLQCLARVYQNCCGKNSLSRIHYASSPIALQNLCIAELTSKSLQPPRSTTIALSHTGMQEVDESSDSRPCRGQWGQTGCESTDTAALLLPAADDHERAMSVEHAWRRHGSTDAIDYRCAVKPSSIASAVRRSFLVFVLASRVQAKDPPW